MGKITGSFAKTYDRFVKRKKLLPDGLLALVREYGPRAIVEFGCGTGAVAVGLALEGYDVIGVDYSPGMLAAARRKARQYGANVRFVRADIIEADLRRKFDLLLCLGNIVPHFTATAQLKGFLRNCRQQLEPGRGAFIFQQLNYDRILVERPHTFTVDIDGDAARFKQYRYKRNLVDFVVTIIDGSKIPPRISVSRTTLRPWTCAQLTEAAANAGFENLRPLGNFGGETFSPASKDLILVGTACAKEE
jgi:2-polyprenyl-3-methyl-5-hydroxy-6-metoxy-1,4-benzoquinol methylase